MNAKRGALVPFCCSAVLALSGIWACSADFRGPVYEIAVAPAQQAQWIDACGNGGQDITLQAVGVESASQIQANANVDVPLNFFGQPVAPKVTVGAAGFIQLGGAQTNAEYLERELLPNALFVYDDFLSTRYPCDAGACNKVCYRVSGEAPHRTLAVEWRNTDSVYQSASSSYVEEQAHYEAQLHESTNVIDLLYRELPEVTPGYATIGVVNGDKSVGQFYCASTDATEHMNGATVLNNLNGSFCPLAANSQIRLTPSE